jgi:excisionase family DNA binding protein
MDQWNSDVDQIIALLRQLTDGLADVRKQFMENQKPHLTVEELAELVGRKPYTVRSWITDGKITAIRVSGSGSRGRLLVPRSELNRLIQAGKGSLIPSSAITPIVE